MSRYYSSSSSPIKRLLGQDRPLHALFGGGKVADIILWRDKRVSASILAGISIIWTLFEVLEYNFLSLLCHISITAMLLVFIWSNGAALLGQPPPKIPELILSEKAFTRVALTFRAKLTQFLSLLHYVACGKDLKWFLLTVLSLWILSVIGSWCSTISLLFFVLVCGLTIPALYERYEEEVDYLASRGSQDLKEFFKRVDSRVLERIPRGPGKRKSN
ncbi:reticulon-like protein B9 [Zingiber officinale]|uniref:reticulon-like protein B9 n=1 Tax=Zingiber officinale TaxID=94328 RepID=UPI001C4D639E|nr:reticulon-like protein B9 [Zingiber officinale]